MNPPARGAVAHAATVRHRLRIGSVTAKVITATLGTRCPRVLVARCLRRSEKIRPTEAEPAAAPDPARDFGFWKFKPPARAGQVSSLLALRLN